ncbi:hypothetical protein AB2X58_004280 [Escherichia coli]|uniref:hypothetical protein n=1 Tax=Escherichia coli TaxID=562 RepID=UPI0002CC5F49|nr:hypothetical protein [Escherichia coli]EFO0323841.1 hypothetical protein [Escherichia albertii]EEQ1710390.1 hypothetical protein [Escherichia coli]EET4540798.1 hypothetical protein [Escherichia coli]EEY4953590.1 hypothetical protein [Escherichia coli]EEY4972437.1 hypothetical protein [Escherichia coli]
MKSIALALALLGKHILYGVLMKLLIPLTQKGPSLAYNLNFLAQDGNIYISDNHRIALWCWMQHLQPDKNIALFHIDRHYDALNLYEPYISKFPGVFNLKSYLDYLSLEVTVGGNKTPLIRWDNYLSFFISDDALQNHIECIYLATHNDGTYPQNPFNHCFRDIEPYELLENLDSAIDNHEKIIINIDLDYFFTGEHYLKFIDDAFIKELFKTVRAGIDKNKIACLTICLSPECCGDTNGSWSNSEYVLDIAKKELGINLTL